MNINDELNKLDNKQRQELEKWFVEQIYKLNKVKKNSQLNYIPFVTRKQVVWIDFGVNIGQELNHSHPAVVLYSRPNVGPVLVAPLKYKDKYYNNFNIKTGIYSNPELTSKQMNLIDNAIQKLKYRSK